MVGELLKPFRQKLKESIFSRFVSGGGVFMQLINIQYEPRLDPLIWPNIFHREL